MIYDINGTAASAYTLAGESTVAYNISGEQVYPSDFSIKVMSYNCGEWYYGGGDNVPAAQDAEYYALQNGMIAAANPDVLLIQEYWKTFSKAGRTALSMLQQYFPYIHEQGGTSGYFGRCICSKYPISDYTVRTYNNDANRYYDTCTITVHGIPITFVNTHLDTDATKRAANVSQLVPFLESLDRFVLAGDLNTLTCKATTDADYTRVIAPLLDAGFHVANCGDFGFMITYSDEPTGTWDGCLDNIVTSSNITINSAYVDDTKLHDGLVERTDHMPLIATLTISA